MTTRRRILQATAGLVSWQLLPHAQATPETLRAAIQTFTGGAAVQTDRVKLDIASLVDNGNTVPVLVEVASPMTAADHVKRIGLFNEANPQPKVSKVYYFMCSGCKALIPLFF